MTRGYGSAETMPAADPTIRPALPADVPALTAIYNHGIAERQATFETRPRTDDEVAAWLDGGLPLLVAETDGVVAGFARLTPYSDRCVYAGVAEHGVYVAPDARGRGLGRRLLCALAQAGEDAGLYKLTSRVFVTNAASRAAHRAAGFSEVGVQRHHGCLEGRWIDCVLVERLLGAAAAAV
jgi:L-amino acid N-acyltransferase YncA